MIPDIEKDTKMAKFMMIQIYDCLKMKNYQRQTIHLVPLICLLGNCNIS